MLLSNIIFMLCLYGAVNWGTALQVGRSRIRIPTVLLEFLLTYSFRPYYGLGVDWASNRNKHQRYLLGGKGGRCLRLTTLPPSHAVCLEILGSLRAYSSLSRDSSTFSFSCYIIIYWTIVVLFPMLRYGGIRVMEIECEAKIHCLSLCRLRSVFFAFC